MLKKFFLNFLSSFVATWLALGLFVVALVIVCIGLAAKFGGSSETVSLKKNSVLVIELEGPVEEREQPEEFDFAQIVQGNLEQPMTLHDLTEAIREAASNEDVKMIYLKCNGVQAAPATLNALRNELKDFKDSGKKIYAYGNSYGTGDYYVASVADSLFINANGSIGLQGITSTSLYLKNLFDKLGIQFQVVKVGTFKSAVEPYISNEMSGPARAQLDTLDGNIWSAFVTEISTSRKLKENALNNLIDIEHLALQEGDFAVKNGLADAAVYERTMDARIARALGVDKEKLNYVEVSTMLTSQMFDLSYESPNQIAVLYATGEIMEGVKKGINCEVLVPQIIELADDDNVKALVLRVNSPGGSVFGSEQIAEALKYFKSTGKKFAVSMGDYAASGGYWISADADRIFADPLTITGSIGIFGLIPNIEGLMGKIGVTPQFVSTNPDANFPNLMKSMTPAQMDAMQVMIEKGYDKFIKRVANGRHLPEAKVRQIAEGRVWDGATALKLGLVDQLGGLADACEWVGKDISGDADIVAYPKVEDNFWSLVKKNAATEMTAEMKKMVIEIVPDALYANEVADALRRNAMQARMTHVRITVK